MDDPAFTTKRLVEVQAFASAALTKAQSDLAWYRHALDEKSEALRHVEVDLDFATMKWTTWKVLAGLGWGAFILTLFYLTLLSL